MRSEMILPMVTAALVAAFLVAAPGSAFAGDGVELSHQQFESFESSFGTRFGPAPNFKLDWRRPVLLNAIQDEEDDGDWGDDDDDDDPSEDSGPVGKGEVDEEDEGEDEEEEAEKTLSAADLRSQYEAMDEAYQRALKKSRPFEVLTSVGLATGGMFTLLGGISRAQADGHSENAAAANTGDVYESAVLEIEAANARFGVFMGTGMAMFTGGVVSAIYSRVRSKRTAVLRERREQIRREMGGFE